MLDHHDDDIVGGEIAHAEAADAAALGLRHHDPHRQVDHRLHHPADQPDHHRRPVLELFGQGGLAQGPVDIRQALHATSWAKTCSITASIGGSSTVRSSTGRSLSKRPVTRAVSALGTRSLTRPSALSTTWP